MPGLIECDGCGRSFVTDDPAGMLAAIKGPCPGCGGAFRRGTETPADPPANPPVVRRSVG